MSTIKSRLRKIWEAAVDQLEEDFCSGGYTEEQAKARLIELFGSDELWWVLYDMRKHDIPYGS